MKHIKLVVHKIPWGDTYVVKIAEQTNRNSSFGRSGGWRFVASNGLVLESESLPEHIKGSNKCYVRGSDSTKDDKNLFFGKENLDKFVLAVKEYNEEFKDVVSVPATTVACTDFTVG